jgi:hypothetical protein
VADGRSIGPGPPSREPLDESLPASLAVAPELLADPELLVLPDASLPELENPPLDALELLDPPELPPEPLVELPELPPPLLDDPHSPVSPELPQAAAQVASATTIAATTGARARAMTEGSPCKPLAAVAPR